MTTEQMDEVDAMRAGFKSVADQRAHQQAKPLGEVLNEVVGKTSSSSVNVQALALQVIDESPNLKLSLAEWVIVQGMVERGILRGMQESH